MKLFSDIPTWGKFCLVLGIIFAVLIVIGASIDEEPAELRPYDGPTATEAPAQVKMPDLKGRNGAKAEAILEGMGVAEDDITLGSPGHWVILPENWTVVSSDPRPGEIIEPGDVVVLTVRQ